MYGTVCLYDVGEWMDDCTDNEEKSRDDVTIVTVVTEYSQTVTACPAGRKTGLRPNPA